MRHRVDHRKLGRTHAHRKAMLANMVMSLFERERIVTTDAKAKEARRTAERLITRAKKGYAAFQEHKSLKDAGKEAEAKRMQAVALGHWRQASRVVRKRKVLRKLFDEIAPMYMERDGGYTRILHTGNRLGDNAPTVLLELVDSEKGAGAAKRGASHAAAEAKPKAKAKAKAKAKKAAKKTEAGEAKADSGKTTAKSKSRSKAKAKAAKVEAKAEEAPAETEEPPAEPTEAEGEDKKPE